METLLAEADQKADEIVRYEATESFSEKMELRNLLIWGKFGVEIDQDDLSKRINKIFDQYSN